MNEYQNIQDEGKPERQVRSLRDLIVIPFHLHHHITIRGLQEQYYALLLTNYRPDAKKRRRRDTRWYRSKFYCAYQLNYTQK